MKKKAHDAVQILKDLMKDDPDFERYYRETHVNTMVAQIIYDARKDAELTQKELAQRVGTTQSVISQLEDADYDGHSLKMLQRIAEALDQIVEVRFVPKHPLNKRKPSMTKSA